MTITLPQVSALVVASLCASLSSASAQPAEPTALLRDWATANSACRGGHGDDPATQDACARRETIDARLKGAGWCYGRPGDPGYRRTWQRCSAGR
ncbi:hypothetical protein HCU64_20380 [Methylobacterium sp. C25]|uniref:hypothetical protein n=1 Tax=Methylobacterium sp. C25 TaxID=2721622 RepID=UPI001F1ADEB8|nr:hypothetical protein [Methylobacterium sp. C25]MCE4226112.1 hypothetical protein [Methylobacterium sp. C25]